MVSKQITYTPVQARWILSFLFQKQKNNLLYGIQRGYQSDQTKARSHKQKHARKNKPLMRTQPKAEQQTRSKMVEKKQKNQYSLS